VHEDDKRKAPFVIGAIELDEEPVVRTWLEVISAERNFAGAVDAVGCTDVGSSFPAGGNRFAGAEL
jgi:hypothetical protein